MANHDQKPETFVIPLCTCWFNSNGVLMCVSQRAERTVENYSMLTNLLSRLTNNGTNKARMLLDFTRTELPSREVRDYLAQELPKYLHSLAIFAASPVGHEVAKATDLMLEAPYPIRVFKDIHEAERWLLAT